VASEDFFVSPDQSTPGPPDENPNYHSQNDRIDGIDADFAADIARALAAAAWLMATSRAQGFAARRLISETETRMADRSAREVDTRKQPAGARAGLRRVPRAGTRAIAAPSATAFAAPSAAPEAGGVSRTPEPQASAERVNALTGTPVLVTADAPVEAAAPRFAAALSADVAPQGGLIDRALAFVQNRRSSFGFGAGEIDEFVPDPVVQRTSSGSAAVHLHQTYRGLPVFQMTRTVRFNPQSAVVDAAGDNAPLPGGIDVEPKLDAVQAVLKAAEHLASTGHGETYVDRFKQEHPVPTIDITGFEPKVQSAFPLPSRPTVLERGPFENPIPGYLLIFNQPQSRLAWHFVLTFPDYADQYAVIVSADEKPGEILYSKSTLHRAVGRGRVFEFSPGVANRRIIDFPRPLAEFPDMPTVPLTGFPADWVDQAQTIGNSVRATLNFSDTSFDGVSQNGGIVFDPAVDDGDDQKLLNIFYFCNYMHDFLFILGFDEAAGNFQRVNFTHTGLGGDPVRARAHSGPVNGTANMSTGVDGQPPVMNMGLVASTQRHTAFDADVVFHEYTHGLTNRLVGGPLDTASLDEPQSFGMGEGWSDFFALTIQNFFRTNEKVVTGDWVADNPAGIRSAPYDDHFPLTYRDIATMEDEHDIGEVWCAALMMMARRIRRALGSDQNGYRIAWQMVVDGLKLTQANPTFLDARDGILRALDDMKAQARIPPATHKAVRRASWEAFAHFGMGVSAFSADAGLDGITEDRTLPADL
jgi:extracellular elastinolytic metalloproteinase